MASHSIRKFTTRIAPLALRRGLVAPTKIVDRAAAFHSTPSQSFPVRRRRRSMDARSLLESSATEYDEDGEDATEERISTLTHEAITDPKSFNVAAKALLAKVYGSLEPLKRCNNFFILTRGIEEGVGEFIMLDLGPVLGQYTIQVDEEQHLLLLQSPISGRMAYVLSASTGEWCGEQDGHAFEGMLVRDLIRQINGVPQL